MQTGTKTNLKRQIELKEQLQYNYQREKYLRYGDYIILKGSEKPYKYLSSRSILEENVEANDYSIIDYPNFSELLFAIYPNHYYEASKAYDKFQAGQIYSHSKSSGLLNFESGEYNQERVNLENMSGKEINKFDTLKRRMEAEIEINDKRVNQFRGQYVTIGQEIMLYHVYSNSFIKATREKSDEDQNLFHIKLTQTPSSSTHFIIRINPYLNFKKDGEKIAYDELFYFENTKYHSVFSIQIQLDNQRGGLAANMQQHHIQTTSRVPMLSLNSEQQLSKKQIVEEDTRILNYKKQSELYYVPTIEQLNYFMQNPSGHRKVQKERIDTFQAIFIKKPSTNNPAINQQGQSQNQQSSQYTKGSKRNQSSSTQILWGDYVRLRHLLRSNKKNSSIHIESNICGYQPKAFAVVKDETNLNDRDSCCDIFQIIPEKESDLGQPVEFDNFDYGFSCIRLRLFSFILQIEFY